jgi:hypothetical protein
MIGFCQALSLILDANTGLWAIMIRPLPQRDLDHPVFGAGMAILQVAWLVLVSHACLNV